MRNYLIALVLLKATISFSQNKNSEESAKRNFNDVAHNKGKMFVFWGWNRDNYSNIFSRHLKG